MADQATIDAYKRLLATATQGRRRLVGLALRHPLITAPYYFIKDTKAWVLTDENGVQQTFNPSGMSAELEKRSNDLDVGGLFTLAVDTSNLKNELDRIPIESSDLPTLTLLVWIDDYPDDPVEVYKLNIAEISYEKGLVTFRAVSPQLDLSQSGLRYSLEQFPVLRGAL